MLINASYITAALHSCMNFWIIILFDTGKYFVAVHWLFYFSLPSVSTWPDLKENNSTSIFKIIQVADLGISGECYPRSSTPQHITNNDPWFLPPRNWFDSEVTFSWLKIYFSVTVSFSCWQLVSLAFQLFIVMKNIWKFNNIMQFVARWSVSLQIKM